MNPSLPTKLTIGRIVLTPVVIWLTIVPSTRLVAFLLFVLVAVSDTLDGYLARRLHQTSALGAFLDPVADKILVLAFLLVLPVLDPLYPWWVTYVILLKDGLIVIGWYVHYYLSGNPVVIPSGLGKAHTVVVLVVIGASILRLAVRPWIPEPATPFIRMGFVVLLSLLVALTVVTGLNYLGRLRSHGIGEHPGRKSPLTRRGERRAVEAEKRLEKKRARLRERRARASPSAAAKLEMKEAIMEIKTKMRPKIAESSRMTRLKRRVGEARRKGQAKRLYRPVPASADRLRYCLVCDGIIRKGQTALRCRCNRLYHEECARRIEECPACGAFYLFGPDGAIQSSDSLWPAFDGGMPKEGGGRR